MKKFTGLLGVSATIAILSAPAMATNNHTTYNSQSYTNLQTSTGKAVGSLRQEHYQKNRNRSAYDYSDPKVAIYDERTNTLYVDNPTRDDPEFDDRTDMNWDWPKELTFHRNVNRTRPLFGQLDDNNNGMISQMEFEANTIHDNEAAVFAMLDKNEDGGISRYELKNYSKTGMSQ